MNTDDTVDLLTWVQLGDGRTVGRGDVAWWHEQARLAGWTLPEARDAVTRWKAKPENLGTWIEPAHITAEIKSARYEQRVLEEARERAQRRAEREGGGSARRRPIEALTRRFGRLPGPTKPETTVVVEPTWSVRCRWCGAAPGDTCTRSSRRGRVPCRPHPCRHEDMATANEAP